MSKIKETLLNTSTPTEPNAWSQYAEAACAHDFVGDLFKFTKGDYTTGKEGREIPIGTRFVVNMDSLQTGWVKWEENRPVGRRMGKLIDGFKPPLRSTLGDTDQELWAIGDDHKPEDPWKFSNDIVFADAVDGDLYTFTTSSKGGLNAIGELCKVFGHAVRQRPDEWPVVEIGVGSYAHSNKNFGRIKFPIFKVVGWVPVGWVPKDGGEPAPPTDTPEPSTPPPTNPKAAAAKQF